MNSNNMDDMDKCTKDIHVTTDESEDTNRCQCGKMSLNAETVLEYLAEIMVTVKEDKETVFCGRGEIPKAEWVYGRLTDLHNFLVDKSKGRELDSLRTYVRLEALKSGGYPENPLWYW